MHKVRLTHDRSMATHRGQEFALRYVLEDGKLNVCLRNLVEWRKFHRERQKEEIANETQSVSAVIALKCGAEYTRLRVEKDE